MLVKRNDNQNAVECLYESSNILASKYDKQTKELFVTFNRGAQYKYENVGLTDYTRFELADSQGTILNSHIKKYTFSRMPDVNADLLIAEIKASKPKEMSAEEKILIRTMENFLLTHKGKSEINMTELKSVELAIEALKITKQTNELKEETNEVN